MKNTHFAIVIKAMLIVLCLSAVLALASCTPSDIDITNTAELSEKYGIMAKNVAEIALPNCNIVYIDGDKMESYLGAYFEVLFNANPKSVGGSIPDEKLYYKK